MHKAISLYVVVAVLGTLLTFTAFQSRSQITAVLLPGDATFHQMDAEQAESAQNEDEVVDQIPQDDSEYKKLFPVQESHLSRTLVLASVTEESTAWVEEELGDLLQPDGPLTTAIYVSDDLYAPLHPPQNSGHEANVYLTYIIGHYDVLPDVVIFMHAHRTTWHNNDLLDQDSALTVRNLSSRAVMSDGYANLRCHWDPGCPDWIHPNDLDMDDFKQEQSIIANAWSEIFPDLAVPDTLAQPCCGQFAVSRDRITSIGKARYEYLRDWIYSSALGDYLTGRVFEYLWQYMLGDEAVACPLPQDCYCNLYGVCFDSDAAYEAWVDVNQNITHIQADLDNWSEKSEYHREHCLPDALQDIPGHDDTTSRMHAALHSRLEDLDALSVHLARVAFDNGRRSRGL
ncbi:hypothetical protein LTR86_004325 [Recurvomyces mirabilis]|nr:hypothetical protein LTR86_004325 [Recurvomyces mirabilis]